MRKLKPSGIEWIGDVPEGWRQAQLGLIFSEHKLKNAGMLCDNLLSLSYGHIIQKNIKSSDGLLPANFEGYNVIDAGDIVLRLTDLQNDQRSLRVGLCKEKGIVTSAYVTIRHRSTQNDRIFWYYLLYSFDICKGFYGMGSGVRQGLNFDGVRKVIVCYPDVKQQKSIASYLDTMCAQLDALVANEQAQIEKLKQFRKSVITEAVTKGLNPTAPTKPSGVEWIGYMPKHWNLQIIGSLFEIKKDIIGKEPENVLSITQQGIKVKDTNINSGQMATSYAHYQIVRKGYFAMNHMDLITGWIDISEYDGVTSPDYRVFRIKDESLYPSYFLRAFQSYYANRVFYGFGQGVANTGRWRLPANNFRKMPIPFPPVSEQRTIAEYLDTKCAEIDALIGVKEAKIVKLGEYKKALIYECVTGKREVEAISNAI